MTKLTELTGLTVDKGDRVDKVDRVDRVEKVDRVDRIDSVDTVYRTFPGEASQESALPTSLLACSSGGWPLSLLEVHIIGSVQVYDINGWQYTVVTKLISSSFRMMVILLKS